MILLTRLTSGSDGCGCNDFSSVFDAYSSFLRCYLFLDRRILAEWHDLDAFREASVSKTSPPASYSDGGRKSATTTCARNFVLSLRDDPAVVIKGECDEKVC